MFLLLLLQPCLDAVDFRAQQCEAWNREARHDRFYRWAPYHDEDRPCALVCRGEPVLDGVLDGVPDGVLDASKTVRTTRRRRGRTRGRRRRKREHHKEQVSTNWILKYSPVSPCVSFECTCVAGPGGG